MELQNVLQLSVAQRRTWTVKEYNEFAVWCCSAGTDAINQLCFGGIFFDTKCKCSRICLEDNLKIFKKHFYCFYFLIFEKGIVESKTHLILHKLRERERNVLNIYEHLFWNVEFPHLKRKEIRFELSSEWCFFSFKK